MAPKTRTNFTSDEYMDAGEDEGRRSVRPPCGGWDVEGRGDLEVFVGVVSVLAPSWSEICDPVRMVEWEVAE